MTDNAGDPAKREKEMEERRERIKKEKEAQGEIEVRYGMQINPNPAVRLKTPKPQPPLTGDELAAKEKDDAALTAQIEDNLDKYTEIVSHVSLFAEMGEEELGMAARALEVVTFRPGDMVYDEGMPGRDAWVLEEGTVISSTLIPGIAGAGWEWKETRPYKPGRFGSFFGERGLRRGEPRQQRMVCLTAVKALRITQESYVACARMREYKENLLRGVQLFEQMTDDQIGKLAAVIKMLHFKPGDTIYTSGNPGDEFYIIESGEASTNPPPPFFTSPRNYQAGEIFGEKALLEANCVREATVQAVHDVNAYTLTREVFEATLGPLARLQMEQLKADPRSLLAQFYQPGDSRGPLGTLQHKNLAPESSNKTSWFAVYRPCSRDSIAKMLGRVGVGKGLNIKGKSAQKNRLSGFVPFLQISNNDHKKDIEKSPKDARTKVCAQHERSSPLVPPFHITPSQPKHKLFTDLLQERDGARGGARDLNKGHARGGRKHGDLCRPDLHNPHIRAQDVRSRRARAGRA